MELIRTRAEWRRLLESWRAEGSTAGLVPTMGALHEGHLSLVESARSQCDAVGMTVFVNPLQFGDPNDLAAYPRDLERDLEVAAGAGVDAVFAPSAGEMYGLAAGRTRVVPGSLATVLEGRSRPGHFEGVALVVTKLLSLAGRTRAYFGEKDFQQLAIVRQLIDDLDLDAEVVACPIVREAGGLALSSRNTRLSPAEREAATSLYRALVAGRERLERDRDVAEAETTMAGVLGGEPLVETDYAVVVDPRTFERPDPAQLARADPGELRLLVAADVGPVRLIDNLAAVP